MKQPGPDYRRALQVGGRDRYVYPGYCEASHLPLVVDGDDVTVVDVTARSLDGYGALELLDHTSDVDVVDNELYGGVRDEGSDDLYTSGNAFPDG